MSVADEAGPTGGASPGSPQGAEEGAPEGPAPEAVEGATGDLRQRAVDVLCEAFADDVMTVEEFERRVEVAHRAASVEELRALLADLPRERYALTRSRDSGAAGARGADRPGHLARTFPSPARARLEEVPERSFLGGVMGGGSRTGPWIPARWNGCVAVMGGVEMDFREAIFPPGVTQVHVLAFWGGIEMIVPPGVRVESSVVGVMGGFDEKRTVAPTDDPDAPTLRITGLAIMGGIDLQVRYPGETSKDARRRVKEERKRLARVSRGELPEPEDEGRG